jgi:hypothetical protein
MSSPLPNVALDPVTEAVNADRFLWDLTQPRPSDWLAVRDQAVRRAIDAGRTVQDLADALQMRSGDIDRILNRVP